MQYESTRSHLSGSDTFAVLQGLAPDGGLFLDKTLGSRPFDVQACLKKNSLGMAEMILSYLMPGFENMKELVEKAYTGKFETEDLTPLVKVGDAYVLELFRGPTSAFKDVALSMLPQLMTAARKQENMHSGPHQKHHPVDQKRHQEDIQNVLPLHGVQCPKQFPNGIHHSFPLAFPYNFGLPAKSRIRTLLSYLL